MAAPSTPRSNRQTPQLRETAYEYRQTTDHSPARSTRSLPHQATITDSPIPPYPYSQTSKHQQDGPIDEHANSQPLSAPASQESFLSVQSNCSSNVTQHLKTSTNSSPSQLTQSTQYTDPTSPDEGPLSQSTKTTTNGPPTRRDAHAHVRTPEPPARPVRSHDSNTNSNALASPMDIISPASINGTKRTASGHVKTANSVTTTPTTGPLLSSGLRRRSRGESMSSTTSSRASEMAATLRTRLEYAMAKVQHGWENRTLAEVEVLAAQRQAEAEGRYSVGDQTTGEGHVNGSGRPASSGLSNGTARLSIYETYGRNGYGYGEGITCPPNKRHSSSTTSPRQHQPPPTNPPRLAPPVDLRPRAPSHSQRHHQSTTRPARTYSNASHTTTTNTSSGSVMSPPRTPNLANSHPQHTPTRPPTIRTQTETAAAERDALAALFQLGSPRASSSSVQGQLVPCSLQQGQGKEGPRLGSPLAVGDGGGGVVTPRKAGVGRAGGVREGGDSVSPS